MTTTIEPAQADRGRRRLVSFDLTRKCQLACTHCYNGSGPAGTHGTMTRDDWTRVLNQAAEYGVSSVQFIGGEPTTHPDLHQLTGHALHLGLAVEVFSNLVRVTEADWTLFALPGVCVATSYYSDQVSIHDAVTGRASHGRTRANIGRAVRLGIALRVGIVTVGGSDDGGAARADLEALGVTRIHVDRVREFGRGARGRAADMSELCGHCGAARTAIDPTGKVSPCVMSAFVGVGNVKDDPLGSIIDGTAMRQATASIRAAVRGRAACAPADEECNPGYPPSECNPKN
ncbi:radical SAM protein [Streptacidiphilus sp. P02-A3a]|uniref:radical SAM protein n=1 Tax=Streptacidiphilus sp. P02-A3a TaxID=2704468 RepID=UPI001CDC290C|nr:radical SAM protein [Streptacidiphilus sp. P02-A3a]